MGQEHKAHLYYVTVFVFNRPILLIGVGKSYAMGDAMLSKNRSKSSKFATPIRLNLFDFKVQLIFNEGFKLSEEERNIRFETKGK